MVLIEEITRNVSMNLFLFLFREMWRIVFIFSTSCKISTISVRCFAFIKRYISFRHWRWGNWVFPFVVKATFRSPRHIYMNRTRWFARLSGINIFTLIISNCALAFLPQMPHFEQVNFSFRFPCSLAFLSRHDG
jgi:hypothetical protein